MYPKIRYDKTAFIIIIKINQSKYNNKEIGVYRIYIYIRVVCCMRWRLEGAFTLLHRHCFCIADTLNLYGTRNHMFHTQRTVAVPRHYSPEILSFLLYESILNYLHKQFIFMGDYTFSYLSA